MKTPRTRIIPLLGLVGLLAFSLLGALTGGCSTDADAASSSVIMRYVKDIGNESVVPLAKATGTPGTRTSSTLTNEFALGVKCWLDVDSLLTSGSVAVKLRGYDPEGAAFVDITSAVTTTVTGAGETELTVYPGIAETSNVSVSDVIPYQWNAVATIVTGGVFSFACNYVH